MQFSIFISISPNGAIRELTKLNAHCNTTNERSIDLVSMKYAPLLHNDHQSTSSPTANQEATTTTTTTTTAAPSKMSAMLSSLKDSAKTASTSVRSGLGLPTVESQDDNDDDANSQASGVLDDMSEYCPKLTFQQVRSVS